MCHLPQWKIKNIRNPKLWNICKVNKNELFLCSSEKQEGSKSFQNSNELKSIIRWNFRNNLTPLFDLK